jgi:hypothetical protein
VLLFLLLPTAQFLISSLLLNDSFLEDVSCEESPRGGAVIELLRPSDQSPRAIFVGGKSWSDEVRKDCYRKLGRDLVFLCRHDPNILPKVAEEAEIWPILQGSLESFHLHLSH